MAEYNNPFGNKKYKYSYSQEVELLENLEHEIIAAANNLDADKILSLMTNFERSFYSDLRISNQQSFDILKTNVLLILEKIKKEKELIAQRQRNIQAKENAYQSLIDIKNSLLKAKTVSEYNKYKEKYNEWLKKYNKSFGWKYNSKISNIKDALNKAIGPESAIDELKNLIASAESRGGFETANPIKDWIAKYPLGDFHEVHQKEIQELTDKAFSLVKINENDIKDLNIITPGFLFLSPTQAYAVYDLKKIMSKNPKDFNRVLDWIYTYRNVSFTDAYRQAISTLIPVDYGLKLDSTYSIPTMFTKDISTSQTKKLVKDTVVNYFGILLCGNSFDSAKKQALSEVYNKQKTDESLSEITKTDEDVDNLINANAFAEISLNYSNESNSMEIDIDNPSIFPEIAFEKKSDDKKTIDSVVDANEAPEININNNQENYSDDLLFTINDINTIIHNNNIDPTELSKESIEQKESISNEELIIEEEPASDIKPIVGETVPDTEPIVEEETVPDIEPSIEGPAPDTEPIVEEETVPDIEPSIEGAAPDAEPIEKEKNILEKAFLIDEPVNYSNPNELTPYDIYNIEIIHSVIEPELEIQNDKPEIINEKESTANDIDIFDITKIKEKEDE